MVNEGAACDLCGLAAGKSPVVRTVGGEQRRFCCEGCARVYEVAHEGDMLDQVKAEHGTGPPPEAV